MEGAALGDRFGRRRMFVIGLGIYHARLRRRALAPGTDALIAARAVQGAGAAIVTPLTLTLLSEAFPPERRGLALGAWSGISGLGVALGPLVGGAVIQGISWHWIFWLNVPFGVVMSPLEAGLRTLPWTGMPMLVAPLAGLLSDRIGSRPLMAAGLALQSAGIAWLAIVSSPDVAYGRLVVPFVMAGTGMALVFAPTANAVLASVRPREAGQASGATNAIREVGGVLGIAVLASVFASHGSYASGQAFTDGMTSAIWVGAAVLAAGALVALLVPGRRSPEPQDVPNAALASS